MTIARLYKNYKPFGFFSIIAAFLTIIALAFFIPVFVSFWQTGVVDKIPTLIVCGFVEMAAISSFFTGMMLSTMTEKDRQDYEFRMQLTDKQYKDLLK